MFRTEDRLYVTVIMTLCDTYVCVWKVQAYMLGRSASVYILTPGDVVSTPRDTLSTPRVFSTQKHEK